MRIVIVEDEVVIREGLAGMIGGMTSHSVVGKCQSGDEGLAVISRMRPDCVITDIRMSGMSGLEMLTKLQEQKIMPYSIIISGYSDFDYAREAIRLGVEEYLLKPISIDALEKALGRIEEKLQDAQGVFGTRSENYLRAYLFGTEIERETAKKKLQAQFPENGKGYAIFVGYYGQIEKDAEMIEHLIRHVKRKFPDGEYIDTVEGRLNLRIIVAKGEQALIREFTEEFDEIVV